MRAHTTVNVQGPAPREGEGPWLIWSLHWRRWHCRSDDGGACGYTDDVAEAGLFEFGKASEYHDLGPSPRDEARPVSSVLGDLENRLAKLTATRDAVAAKVEAARASLARAPKEPAAEPQPEPFFSEAEMDDMHHALGRPDGPHVTPYRNRYVLGGDCEQARKMATSAGWTLAGRMNQGRDAVFRVTEVGQAAMWAWLRERQRRDGKRLYEVKALNCTPRTVLAKSRGAAKYDLYLNLLDAGWCSKYADFLGLRPTAKLA